MCLQVSSKQMSVDQDGWAGKVRETLSTFLDEMSAKRETNSIISEELSGFLG